MNKLSEKKTNFKTKWNYLIPSDLWSQLGLGEKGGFIMGNCLVSFENDSNDN